MSVNVSQVQSAIAHSKVLIIEAELLEEFKSSGDSHYGKVQESINNAIASYLRGRAKEIVLDSV